MAFDPLVANDQAVDGLRRLLRLGSSGLSEIPSSLKHVLRHGCWRRRVVSRLDGREVAFGRFEDFVATAPLEGLGADLALIRRIVADDPEAVELLKDAMEGKAGRPPVETAAEESLRNQKRIRGPQSTDDAGYALRRLRKDRPDLHGKVLTREMSPHAAMVEAGFRRKRIQIPADPEGAGRQLARHFSREEWDRLVAAGSSFYGPPGTPGDEEGR